MRYAFEGPKSVGWGPHPALGPPVGQPWSTPCAKGERGSRHKLTNFNFWPYL